MQRRRAILTTLGSVGVGTLAGCTGLLTGGDGSEDDEDEADEDDEPAEAAPILTESFEDYETGGLPPSWEVVRDISGTTGVASGSDVGVDPRDGENVLAVSWDGGNGTDSTIRGPVDTDSEEPYTPSEIGFWVYDPADTTTHRVRVDFESQAGETVLSLFTNNSGGGSAPLGVVANEQTIDETYWAAGWHNVRFTNIDWEAGTFDFDADDGEYTAEGLGFDGENVQSALCRAHGFDRTDFLVDRIVLR